MTTFYEKEGVVKATANVASGTMTVQWDSLLDDKAIEECCEAQIEQVKKGIKVLLLDVATANGVPSQRDKTGLRVTCFLTSLRWA